jgi:ParB-like chromosome segregation protein Spo0J
VEQVPLEEIAADATFRVRVPGDVAELAVSMGRLGQLDPVDLRPLPAASAEGPGKRWQVVAGFRRMEALRLLQREKVLARIHPSLAEDDAWALALAGPLFGEPWTVANLDAIAVRVRASLPWAEPVLAAARRRAAGRGGSGAPATSAPSRKPAAAAGRDPTALAHDLIIRAYELNQDLAAACEGWSAVPPTERKLVLAQLRYLARLLPMLEGETT